MAEKAGGPGPVCSGGSLRDLLEVTVDLDLHSDGLDDPGRKLRDRVGARWIARPVSDRVDLIKNRIAQAGARASDWGGGFGILYSFSHSSFSCLCSNKKHAVR